MNGYLPVKVNSLFETRHSLNSQKRTEMSILKTTIIYQFVYFVIDLDTLFFCLIVYTIFIYIKWRDYII